MTDDSAEQSSVIGDLLFSSKSSVFRFEGLPSYCMEEEQQALDAWKRGAAFSWPNETLDFVHATHADVARGVRHTRVRAVPKAPAIEYFNFEMTFYPLLVEAGVDIRLITAEALRTLGREQLDDFYVFDNQRAVCLRYDEHGSWLREEELQGQSARLAITLVPMLIELSTPLAQFRR